VGAPHVLVPLSHPIDGSDPRISGPLWIGPIGNAEAMASMTEGRAIELCSPRDEHEIDESELRLRRRAAARAVRHISEEADSIHASNLIVVDSVPPRLGTGSPPSPAKLAKVLCESGHAAAVAAYGEPAVRTDAPWSAVEAAVRSM